MPMDTEIRVKEAMTSPVEVVETEMALDQVARRMVEKKIGCVVVVVDGQPVGIVTEWDLCRTVAEDRKPSEVRVKEIMTTPLYTTHPDVSLTDASKEMTKHNIRRLPVIDDGRLVGIVTTKDIIAISPEQIEILREFSKMGREEVSIGREVPERGTCEACGDYGVRVYDVDGDVICESCREDRVVEE
jgi:CBS domain-containing protein